MLLVNFEIDHGPMSGASAESREIETHNTINSTSASTHANIIMSIAPHQNLGIIPGRRAYNDALNRLYSHESASHGPFAATGPEYRRGVWSGLA